VCVCSECLRIAGPGAVEGGKGGQLVLLLLISSGSFTVAVVSELAARDGSFTLPRGHTALPPNA
jgi:hypothetical protein